MHKKENLLFTSIISFIQKWLNQQTQNPIVLFQIKDFILIRFGVVSAIALLFGLISFIVLFKEIGIEDTAIHQFLFYSPISLILFSFVLNFLLKLKNILEDIRYIRNITFGFFGGIIGIILSFIIITRINNINPFLVFDGSAILAGFIHGYARTACMNYGCCHGKEISNFYPSRLHILYTSPLAKAIRVSGLTNMPLYPIQLYESLGCFLIGFLVLCISYFYHRIGLLLGVYFLLYGSLRFTCEFFRGETDTIYMKGFSVYQWISLSLILIGFIISIWSIINGTIGNISFHWSTLSSLKNFWIYILVMPSIILFFYGFHYKKIGKWC